MYFTCDLLDCQQWQSLNLAVNRNKDSSYVPLGLQASFKLACKGCPSTTTAVWHPACPYEAPGIKNYRKFRLNLLWHNFNLSHPLSIECNN